MSRVRAAVAAITAGVLLMGFASAPASAADDDDANIVVEVPESTQSGSGIANAELRWGLNLEAGSGAYYGGCNFLSAGRAGDAGSARLWEQRDGLYRSSEDAVTIVRPDVDGWTEATWDTKCTDRFGAEVTVASLTSATENSVVMTGGQGAMGESGLNIQWSGSFTVVFYGGLTYWTASDPQLTVEDGGAGRLTATVSGYATSMEDMTKWEPIPERVVVLAELRDVDASEGGFAVVPEYLGVEVADVGQAPRTNDSAEYWGAFPASFLEFQRITGQLGYWLTTGGARDRAKPATVLTVNFDAQRPAVVTPPSEAVTPAQPAATGPFGGFATPGGGAAVAPGGTLPAPGGEVGASPALPLEGAALQMPAGDVLSAGRARADALVPGLGGWSPSPLLLPLGGAVLAALLAALLSLHLAGIPILPFRRATS